VARKEPQGKGDASLSLARKEPQGDASLSLARKVRNTLGTR
jgi:hypothetical protein